MKSWIRLGPVTVILTGMLSLSMAFAIDASESGIKSGVKESYALGEQHYKEQEYEQAVQWFLQAAENGHRAAQYKLGLIYENGWDVGQNYQQALKWYTKAAEQGDASAQYHLGLMYQDGAGLAPDNTQAAKWLLKAAEQNDTASQINLSILYMQGTGVALNIEKGLQWLHRAVGQGSPDAEANLAVLYITGFGVPQDFETARIWSLKAARKFNGGQYAVANQYINPDGVSTESSAFYDYLVKASETGHVDSQFLLGVIEEYRNNATHDYQEAERWYLKAAEQGHPFAQARLASLYQRGYVSKGTIETDLAEAAIWYLKAAEKGVAQAQLSIGMQFVNGYGIPSDPIKGYQWLLLASEQGLEEAINALPTVKKEMTQEQVAEAERLVAAWKEQHPRP